MKIGFDAKRAYHNQTGLGNYSRTLMAGLLKFYPEHEYVGFNPKSSDSKLFSAHSNYKEFTPTGFFDSRLHSIWRSKWITKDIVDQGISLYHGLSNELPIGIENMKCKSVVTIHDLIFEHYPSQYNPTDVNIYRRKFKSAALRAQHIIAISEATKQDLINLYQIPASNISVCWQSIDPRFLVPHTEEERKSVCLKYNLPERFFLSVGSIIERKNLLTVCKAFAQLEDKRYGLVVVGKGMEYKQVVTDFIKQYSLESRVFFLEDYAEAQDVFDDLPLLYSASTAMLYPSRMEGFGLPIVEAFASSTPVITSNVSSLAEVAGEAAITLHPDDVESMTNAMNQFVQHPEVRNEYILKGLDRLQRFDHKRYIQSVMEIYQQVMG